MARVSTSVRSAYRLDEIVDVAVAVFHDRGYDATSMGDIAKAVGITKSSLYHHVGSREELFELGVGRALDALFGVLKDPAAKQGPAVQRVRHVLRRTVAIIAERLPEVALLVRARGNTPAEARALRRRRQFDHAMTALVDQAVRDGELNLMMEPALFTRLALGTAVSMGEWYPPAGRLSGDRLSAAIEEMVFHSPLPGTTEKKS